MKISISNRLLATLAASLAVPCTPLLAAVPGDLDAGFGSGGKVTTPIGTALDRANGVVVQSDGRIVAAGTSHTGSNYDFALVRYNANGTLDTTFGSGGMVTTPISDGNDYCHGMALQSDGKIVAVGYSRVGSRNDFAVVRHNPNGTLDTSFGTNGRVTTSIGTSDYAYGVAIQGDGKIVAAGYSDNGTKNDFVLVRYNSDGSLDTSFDTDGRVSTAFGSIDDRAMSTAVQSDGKIVLAGYSDSGSGNVFALARYNSDGSLDTSFDADGKVTTAIGSIYSSALSVAVQDDGKIVAAGDSKDGLSPSVALARYNSNGSLDASFDADGKATGVGGAANGIVIQSDGKIVVAGYSFSGSNNDFVLDRFNSNGSLDTSFGIGGGVVTPVGSASSAGQAVTLQADGKIVVAGFASNGSNIDFALARYFGTTEPEIAVEQPAGTNLRDNAVQINFGRVQVGGTRVVRTFTVKNVSTAVLRGLEVGRDGANADEFAVGALGATTLAAGTSTTFTVTFEAGAIGSRTAAIHIRSDDADEDPFDIALAGTGIVPPTIATYQILPCGTVGSSYSLPLEASGTAPFTWSVIAGSLPADLGLTGTGTLSGTPSAAGVANFTARVTDNDGLSTTKAFALKIMGPSEPGALDVGFGTGGKVLTPIGSSQDQGSSVALQSNGKIVVAGSYRNSDGNYDFAAVRYNSNGGRDGSFGTEGIATKRISSSDDRCQSVAIQSDGRIVTAGYGKWTGPIGFAAVRFNMNGTVDSGFRGGGLQITQIGTAAYGYGTALQSDDKIVIAGYTDNGSNNDFALVRCNSDGSQDTSFDTDGTLTTSIGSGDDAAYSVVIQSDGKIVAAGYSFSGTYSEFAVVRYDPDGSLDSSFGTGGIVNTDIGSGNDYGFGVALQGDGKILVAGYSDNGGNWDFALVRYNSNGSLDTSFGSGGKVTTPVGDSTDIARSVVVLPNGKILVAGTAANGITSDDVALVLYQSNGSLDTSFGYDGILTTHVGIRSDQAMGLAVQSDGKIVVAGYANNGTNNDFMVLRYVGITEPEIVVEQPAGTNLTDGSGTVDWGYGEINAVSGVLMFTVRNTGNAGLTSLEVTVDGSNMDDFAAYGLGATSLAPGASTTFFVNFSPSVAGYRTATVHVASNDPDENPFDIAAAGTGLSHLEIWRLLNFHSHLDGGNGANDYDFDHDGFVNLLEYAFSGNPKSPDAAVICPTAGFGSGKLSISFRCDAIRTDITYTVQASPTLADGSWTDIARSVGGVMVTPIGSLSVVADSGTGLRTATVTASPTVFPTGRGFLRIRISE